jgi:uracil-DNA glycosylase family 4
MEDVFDELLLGTSSGAVWLEARPFNRSEAVAALQTRVHSCRLCQERGHIPRAHPITEGRASDRILLIGQAPGHVAVEHGRPFTGQTGRILEGWLGRAGFPPSSLHERIYLSSLTKCDPGKSPRSAGDRQPSLAEIALCRPHLQAELTLLRPEVIILLGSLAIAQFLGNQRLEDVVGRAFGSRDVVWRPLWPGHARARLLPLPHASRMSRWLNPPAHKALLQEALAHLSLWREEMQLR